VPASWAILGGLPADPVETPVDHGVAPARWLPACVVLLTVAALVVRVRALPDDGLLFDDAWVSFGATAGTPGELLSVSTLHPGFSAVLMGWSRLVPGSSGWMALPALLAGVALPAAVVWSVRRLDVDPVVAALVGVLAVVAPTHVVYSGRVKPYTLETLAILLLAVALGPLSRRRWTARVAACWVAAAVAVGTVNAFAMVATGVAAIVLVLHPCGDRSVRATAAAVQAVVQVLLLGAMRRSFDHRELEAAWGDTFDGYVELSADLGASVGEVSTHLARVGQVVVVDRPWLALVLVVLAGAGLVAEAWRGRHAVVARFLLALPLVAFAGSIVDQLPFGTRDQSRAFPGTRASLWLLPSVLVGLAFAGERALELARRRGPTASRRLAVVAGVSVAAIVIGALRHDVTYPSPGSETVAAAIDGRGERDLVLVMETARWSYAAVPGAPFDLVPDEGSMVGYVPVLRDEGLEMVNPAMTWLGSAAELRIAAGPAPGVAWDCLVLVEGATGVFDAIRSDMDPSFVGAGFEQVDVSTAGASSVEVWQRAGAPPC
jgi:hypothetical protein